MTLRLATPRLITVPGGVVIRMEPITPSADDAEKAPIDEPALVDHLSGLFKNEIRYRPTCPTCPQARS